MHAKIFLLVGLCTFYHCAVFSSDVAKTDQALKVRYMFSSNEADYDLFLQARPAVGSGDYFANRERVLNSVKGKEATSERIIEVYKAMDSFKYDFVQASKQREGFSPAQVDALIVKTSLSPKNRCVIIHEVKSE